MAITPKKIEELKEFLSANYTLSPNDLPEIVFNFTGFGFTHLEFMMHNEGCWAVISQGPEARIGLGTYDDPEKIKLLIKTLEMGD